MKTREQWLLQACRAFAKDFERVGSELPEVRVSIGWPGGRGSKHNVIGQCWGAHAVKDGIPAIFISPALSEEHPERILDVLVHELVHSVGNFGHKGEFVKLAGKIGLVKPWTATTAGTELQERLSVLAHKLGPFPHSVIRGEGGLVGTGPDRPPVQSTRMLKVVCRQCELEYGEGYTVRTTRKWLEIGLPSCPDGHIMEEVSS